MLGPRLLDIPSKDGYGRVLLAAGMSYVLAYRKCWWGLEVGLSSVCDSYYS